MPSSPAPAVAWAEALASAGARVTIGGRKADDLKAAADKLRAAGHSITEAVIDVTDTQSVDLAIAAAETGTAPIDILVNNAGIQRRAPLETFSDADWDALMATNLDGAFKVSRAVVKGMIARQRGSIINVSSVQSVLARPSIAPYAASKGAITMLTKVDGRRMGPVRRARQRHRAGLFQDRAQRRAGRRRDILRLADRPNADAALGRSEGAGAAVFLASDAASFVSGQTLLVDGGITSVL